MPDPVDFDAAWAEIEAAKGDPPRIKARGEVITLPSSMPAKVVLFQARHRTELEGTAPNPERVAELAQMLLGDKVDQWVDDGMSMAALYTLILAAQALIYGKRKDSEGEAQPPATGDSSTTSSPDGPPSKPTSNASTDGT